MHPETPAAANAAQARRARAARAAFAQDTRVAVSTIWHALEDPAVEAETAELSEVGFIDRPHPAVFRYNYARVGGNGNYLQIRIDPDLVVGLANIVLPEPTRQFYWADEPLLMLRASLSAGCAYTVPGLPSMVFNRPEVVIAYVPQGAEIHVDVYAQARQQSVILLMNATRFLPRFGLSAEELPAVLQGVFDGTAPTGRLITLPLDERLGQLIESMTQSMRNVALHRLAVSGALSELVARVLDAAGRNPAFAGSTGLRHRELDLAHAARELLDQHAAAPPRFADLSRQLGSNQKTLKVVFRRVFGTTMADYCVERRMRLAQSLLLEGRLTIGQVADRVGYEHQSSFTAAFRRHAGMNPREYQRQRAALDVSLTAPVRKNPRPGRPA